MKLMVEEKTPLRWPDGWTRTPIGDRKPQKGWKKSLTESKIALKKELERLHAVEALITTNVGPNDRLDPGVAIYFSLQLKEDYSWQLALGIDSPAPTIDDIQAAYHRKVREHGGVDQGGDVEIFRALTRHRDNARAWILGTQKQEHEYVIPCDRFNETRLNINAVRLAIAAMRQLERVGVPGMLARSFKGFRTALPEHKEAIAV